MTTRPSAAPPDRPLAQVTDARRAAADVCADLRHGELLDPAFDARAARLDARDRRWLQELLFGMRALPQLNRIEAQLMPFGGPVDQPLKEQGFRLYTRQFMLLDLQSVQEPDPAASTGMRLDRWHDRYFDSCAKLIYLSYANHVDGEINDQYRSRSGALRFLKNIN